MIIVRKYAGITHLGNRVFSFLKYFFKQNEEKHNSDIIKINNAIWKIDLINAFTRV